MRLAFLGTGRMGTELALHLLNDHDVTVWNRTTSKTARLAEAGAHVADSPQAAVDGADVVVTALFGPDAIREVVIAPSLIPDGVPWMDTTTVSPADAEEFAEAVPTYIATPVVGTLGPARNGKLGVYVGTPDSSLRELGAAVAAPWADRERLYRVDSAAKASAGKLLANLALAVSAQGLREALTLGAALGLEASETLPMLESTGLSFITNMKRPFVLGERETAQGDFTVDAIAKDARLMLASVRRAEGGDTRPGNDLPALSAALRSLEAEQESGRGDYDFSSILIRDKDG